MDIDSSGLYIEDRRLCDCAAAEARLLRPAGSRGGRRSVRSLRRSLDEIRRTHDAVQARCGELPQPPAACEWLLDNWYIALREYMCAAAALRSAPRLRASGGESLILALARALLRAGLGSATEERCRLFLDGFQAVTVLRRSELELFPAAVRAAAIEGLAETCRKMRGGEDEQALTASFEALFTTLRLFSVLDAEKLINSADVTGAVLSADPGGDYARMDSGTKRQYLRRVEKLARREGAEEHVFARRLIKRARAEGRHVGFYLFAAPGRAGEACYIGANVLLTLFFSLLLAFACDSAAAALLLLLPVSELVKNLLDFILLHTLPSRRLPRMSTEEGVPPEGRTICVISALLTDPDGAQRLAARLEELRQTCRESAVSFGLLADLPSAAEALAEGDGAVLYAARAAVERLNREYGGGFYLFTRPRVFDGESWTGRERKRGAITELARLLCGMDSELETTGERAALSGTRYILTLDSDTRVYPGAIQELIGAMLHPLCKPRVDEKRGVVTAGHAVIHPRMGTELYSANSTDFALIFAGAGGSDPYGGVCGELYMDAFDSGGFAGKGIIDARAFIRCAASRFPAGRVLSHDALEGACLRGAFMGDVEFSDAFPSRPLAYYKRLHRWIRGDWQNARWVFCRDFAPIDRWRLFDSLRRSLIAPMTLLAVCAGFLLPENGLAVAAWAALLALLGRLFISLAEGSVRRREKLRLRRHTRLLTGVGGAIVQTFIRLWLLPYEAFVCLSAVFTALWRMLVSHRRLLQWQTTAQSDGGTQGLRAHLAAMWPSALLGLALLLLSPAIIGRSAGLMWLLSPLAAAALALPAHRDTELSGEERAYITAAARESFSYLAEFSSAADNFLPPDNFQEQPPVGVAHRTSPTNIGLALAAAVAAFDLGVTDRESALGYIRRALCSLECLPRLLGHCYNWYDTRTLRPMQPLFISTVDSGNLYAGLLTARQALRGLGEDELAGRVDALMAGMDFSPLYDRERGLFYICFDAEKQRGAGGWYDLMASEAMLTSYIAAAKGDVPVRHWRALSRAQLQKDGYRGLASWTGTMFEYLMPELFLPFYRGSLLFESGRFCLYVQKRRVFAGKPWGVSESAFYSLDPSLSYRYKASGCAALALKRGQDADMVVSPYSSFLALAVDAPGAVKNLRRLERFGARGRFGFIEALDFTPSRSRSGEGEKVRCYMAHHVSMSVIAAANAVCSGSIQRRFMSDCAMRAFSPLLQERLPDQGLVIRRDITQPPEKPERGPGALWRIRGGAEDTGERRCLLSNGAYSILASSRGESSAAFGRVCVYGAPDLSRRGPALELIQNGQKRPLAPGGRTALWELSEEQCRWEYDGGGLKASVSVCTAAGDWGELRRVELRAELPTALTLRLSFRPILADYRDYVNHPAFWRLGVTAELAGGALLLRRLRRGDTGELWLCLRCDQPALFSAEEGGEGPCLADPFVTADTALTVGPEGASLRYALCLGDSRAAALAGAERILLRGESGGMVGAAAHLGMSAAETGAAMALLRPLARPLSGAASRKELWQYGISGDLPLICCDGQAVEALPLLKRFCLLKSCGADCELVYLSGEQGEYQRPLYRRFTEALSAVGLEALIGCRGGLHLVPMSAAGLVRSRAAVVIGEAPDEKSPLRPPVLSAPRGADAIPRHSRNGAAFEYYVNQSLPARAWQLMLGNGRFGCIAVDCGMAGMWLENARELRISEPFDDIRAVGGTEALWVERDGERLSLFAANDALPCRVLFTPGLARWEKELFGRQVVTEVFVPAGTDARVLLIKGAQGLELRWALNCVLGAPDASSLRCRFDGGLFCAENPEAYLPGVALLAGTGGPCSCRCDFAPGALLMSIAPQEETALVCGCCGEDALRALLRPKNAAAARDGTLSGLRGLLARFSCATGDAPLDRYMNGWAAYQVTACRLEGRSSLYQSGGAFGFRDQLQDAVNLLLLTRRYARERILDCCRHQYAEGDVMHWWHAHPDGDRGIRSRCSDDLLWLVWALCEYVDATGDTALCDIETRYLASPVLSESERDRYETPESTQKTASVLLHARAALDLCAARGFGPHGLPWFGSGDWNDGLDAVDGESVWLGWFLSHCAARMAKLLERLSLPGAERYSALAASVGAAADGAWNGRWYRRGYLADGTPLGGDGRIDSLAQSWAVISGAADAERAGRAMDAAKRALIDRRQSLVRLFAPPFGEEDPYPGYIAGYGEGFRENGGQYTHGAIWLALAFLKLVRADDAWETLSLLLPENHDLRRYKGEPFVLPADVYSAPGHEGEAVWTWYTGSAGWYFRVVTENMLGLRLENGALGIAPALPAAIPSYSAVWTDARGVRHEISADGKSIRADGEKYDGKPIGAAK